MKKDWNLFGCPIDLLAMDEAVNYLVEAVVTKKTVDVTFLNAGKVAAMESDKDLALAVAGSALILADGMAVVWAARSLGIPVPERVAGIDLFMRLLGRASVNRYRVYFLGARQEVLEKTVAQALKHFPGLLFAGTHHGFWNEADEPALVEQIRNSGADMLFIGISSPRKELFVQRNIKKLGVPVVMGVGGSFDVLAGVTPRAPEWMQSMGLEWFYRFLREPGRMWKRYLVGNAIFIKRYLLCKLGQCNCCGLMETD